MHYCGSRTILNWQEKNNSERQDKQIKTIWKDTAKENEQNCRKIWETHGYTDLRVLGEWKVKIQEEKKKTF